MRFVRWLIAIVILGGLCWLFPLFHVVPLKTVTAEKAAAEFNAEQFVESFWTNALLPAVSRAVNVEKLLKAIDSDAAAARTNYSRRLGLSETYYYFLCGTGRVVAISDDGVSLAVTAASTNVEVVLQSGLIFGDAVRDGTGLLNVSDYPDSQDFNDISAALNHVVETRVEPALREQAKIGASLFFVGCAEVGDESADLHPLNVVPIQTRTK